MVDEQVVIRNFATHVVTTTGDEPKAYAQACFPAPQPSGTRWELVRALFGFAPPPPRDVRFDYDGLIVRLPGRAHRGRQYVIVTGDSLDALEAERRRVESAALEKAPGWVLLIATHAQDAVISEAARLGWKFRDEGMGNDEQQH